jgi:hypothetical protein
VPSVPDKKTPEPEKKNAKVKDLPTKQVSDDAATKVKGGAVGPCDWPKRGM